MPRPSKRPLSAEARKPRQAKRPRFCPRPSERAPRQVDLPREVFKLVAEKLAASQASLLRLSVVCRAARDAVLRDCDQLWCDLAVSGTRSWFRNSPNLFNLGPAVVRDLPMMPYPNFQPIEGGLITRFPPVTWRIGRASWPNMQGVSREPFNEQETRALAQHALRCARLSCAKSCGTCGRKGKDVPVWGLGMRVCAPCMKENLVSAAALLADYGVDFTKHEDELMGKVFYFRHAYRPKQLLALFTHNPVDLRQENAQSMVFFWRPHLAKVIDLDAARRNLRDPARTSAAARISSAVRALRVRLILVQRGKVRKICHSFHIGAKSGACTLRPLTDEEKICVLNDLPDYPLREARRDVEGRARCLLQQSYLGWRGPATLPAIKNPDSVLERLRAIEAARGEQVIKGGAPTVSKATPAFRRWFDLPPALA